VADKAMRLRRRPPLIAKLLDRQERELRTIDDTIRATLREFVDHIRRSGWWGKEREAVSYFAFGFLVRSCAVGAELYDPAQIGIEVRVPRPPGLGVKEEITKDLVIWARPGETCWKAPRRSGRFPLAVMQWKVNEGSVSAHDVAWLIALTTHQPGCRGYALCLDLEPRARLRVRPCLSREDRRGMVGDRIGLCI